MVIRTGEGSDLYLFDPHSAIKEKWIDEGGIDILALHDSDRYGMQIVNTGKSIKVSLNGSTLIIPHGEDGLPSIEILEWRIPAAPVFAGIAAHGPTEALLRQGIVTDTDNLIGVGQLFIGDDTDQTISVPSSAAISGSFTDIFAGGGNDVVNLSSTYETRTSGGAGNDVIRATGNPDTEQYGNLGRDKLFGAEGEDILHGGRGRDVLKGGKGDDILLGDGFNFETVSGRGDRMHGGAGDDYLLGGEGRDLMRGGKGADTFEWDFTHLGDGDVIRDFDAAQDRLVLDTHTIDGRLKVRIEDGDTIVSYGKADMVRLEDVTLTLSQIDIDLL